MYLGIIHINFTIKSSLKKQKYYEFRIGLLLHHVCNYTVNCPVSFHPKILVNICISYDSSATLSSWPVTPLFNFMTCNDFKYFNEKIYQQILQSIYYTPSPEVKKG